jgi:hypothetical protein
MPLGSDDVVEANPRFRAASFSGLVTFLVSFVSARLDKFPRTLLIPQSPYHLHHSCNSLHLSRMSPCTGVAQVVASRMLAHASAHAPDNRLAVAPRR